VYIPIIGVAVLLAVWGIIYTRKQQAQRKREEIQISVEELNGLIKDGGDLTILDLRHPLEVLASPQVIPNAIPVPPAELDERILKISRNYAMVLYCTCPNDETSLKAYQQLKDRGFRRVKVLTGGLPAWKQKSLPLQDLYPDLEVLIQQQAAGE
jgi:rhodanese-related sulfurtransferase